MPLDVFNPQSDCLCKCFFGTTPDEMRKTITNDNELEDKTTLAFFVDGEPATAKEFINDYNIKNPDKPISYAGALMERALEDDGIIFYGEGQTKAHTKNLVSYCYEIPGHEDVTLRIRHEEYRDDSGQIKMRAPDISTKFMLEKDDTTSRAEFEKTTDWARNKDGMPSFYLTLVGIMEQQVEKIAEKEGPVRAMQWLYSFTNIVGYDFSDKRERANINCKRTQPYAVMHTRHDHTGNLIKDNNTGKPKLFKSQEINAEDTLKGHKPANKIVFMFCLDVNRVFEPGTANKIDGDDEWEHESQDKKCEFTPGSIKSSDGVTRAEIDAMNYYLKDMKARVMRENNIKLSPLSGMNKDARATIYTKRRVGDILGNSVTVRGKTDNFVLQRVDGFQDLLKQSPRIAKIYDMALAERNIIPIRAKVG